MPLVEQAWRELEAARELLAAAKGWKIIPRPWIRTGVPSWSEWDKSIVTLEEAITACQPKREGQQ